LKAGKPAIHLAVLKIACLVLGRIGQNVVQHVWAKDNATVEFQFKQQMEALNALKTAKKPSQKPAAGNFVHLPLQYLLKLNKNKWKMPISLIMLMMMCSNQCCEVMPTGGLAPA